MTIRWTSLLVCAPLACALALSCGSSDNGSGGGGGGAGGGAGTEAGGRAGSGGSAGTSAGGSGGSGGADQGPDVGGAPDAGGSSGAAPTDAGAGGAADAGAAGAPVVVDTSPLSPSDIPDLALWLDGNSPTYSDLDENALSFPPDGRVRTAPETPPLTGVWQAAPSPSGPDGTSLQRPMRTEGSFGFRPIDSATGYTLRDSAGTIHTDNSTLAISYKPLQGQSGPAQGGINAQIGSSAQVLGIYFVGSSVGLHFNHTTTALKRLLPTGAHVSIVVRFTATGANVQYDINGIRTSESLPATVASETASKFIVGYDSTYNSSLYGYVSQVVGIDRAVSDVEENRLMNWLTEQPIPEAFPVTDSLVSIVGDSIANGDQCPGWQTWAYSMLSDLSNTYPDLQLLNAARNGSGVPTTRGSDYSDYVLPWYSASRPKNILIVAVGTNDLAVGNNLTDIMTRFYALLDAARTKGYKVAVSTILPRSDATALANNFEAARTTFNADLLANWASHADALANIAGISGMGAAGDSNNTTYYSPDKVHPIAAGHALMEPVYRAAVAGLLAAP